MTHHFPHGSLWNDNWSLQLHIIWMSVIELIYFIDCDFNISANKEAGKIDATARDQVVHL